jgi:hypothetical protein
MPKKGPIKVLKPKPLKPKPTPKPKPLKPIRKGGAK